MVPATLFLLSLTSVFGNVCKDCIQTKIFGMSSADCYGRNLRTVPQCFKDDIEILELSYNRLRKITAKEMSKYSNLKILYLADNLIITIEEKALEDKTSLEILDISDNALSEIPAAIFHLPSLTKLNMARAGYINFVHDIERSMPITSPIEYLNIASNELRSLPNLGIMPTLLYYNISGNNATVNISHFAGICNLKSLHNNDSTIQFDGACECWKLQSWLQKRNVEFVSFNCPKLECDVNIPLKDMEIFYKCTEQYDAILRRTYIVKIILPIFGSLGILSLIGLTIYMLRRKKRKVFALKPETTISKDSL